jgi:hypothetical protein
LGISATLEIRGLVAIRENDLAGARAMFRESLEIRRELGDRRGVSDSLTGFAALAFREAAHLRVARLLGAARRILDTIGGFAPQCETQERDIWINAARDALGAEAFDAYWAEGQAMSLEEAISYALEEGDAMSLDQAIANVFHGQ